MPLITVSIHNRSETFQSSWSTSLPGVKISELSQASGSDCPSGNTLHTRCELGWNLFFLQNIIVFTGTIWIRSEVSDGKVVRVLQQFSTIVRTDSLFIHVGGSATNFLWWPQFSPKTTTFLFLVGIPSQSIVERMECQAPSAFKAQPICILDKLRFLQNEELVVNHQNEARRTKDAVCHICLQATEGLQRSFCSGPMFRLLSLDYTTSWGKATCPPAEFVSSLLSTCLSQLPALR